MAEPEAHQEDHETTDIRTIDQGGLAGEAALEEDGAGDLQDRPDNGIDLVGIHLRAEPRLGIPTGDNYFFPVDWVNSFIFVVL
jgi:hypothetical protein